MLTYKTAQETHEQERKGMEKPDADVAHVALPSVLLHCWSLHTNRHI